MQSTQMSLKTQGCIRCLLVTSKICIDYSQENEFTNVLICQYPRSFYLPYPFHYFLHHKMWRSGKSYDNLNFLSDSISLTSICCGTLGEKNLIIVML